MPSPYSVLVTGANRGIGLGFIHHFLKDSGIKHIFAGARDPAGAKELNSISDPRLKIIQLDVQNDASIIEAEKKVAEVVGKQGLTLLINNAGIAQNYDLDAPPAREIILNTLDINVAGVLIVSQVFLPLLRLSAASLSSQPMSIYRAAIVNISSGAASISDNRRGGLIVYRASKTALNSVTKTLAVDLLKDEILTIAILPGYVVTRMTSQKGELTVEESIGMMMAALPTYSKEHSGGFFGKDGKPFPL